MGNDTGLQLPRRAHRRGRSALVGILAGGVCGVAVVSLAGAGVRPLAAGASEQARIEVTHLPPLLTLAGELVELRYDVYCLRADDAEPDEPCAASGSAYVRAGQNGPFERLPLVENASATDGRLGAVVPDAIARARSGFSYYAVFRDPTTGAATTLPASGADAPHRSVTMGAPLNVRLGAHEFGATVEPTERVVEAAWGSGPREVGLEQGRNLAPIGGSSFDVSADGTVHVLDEANRRVLRWGPRSVTPVSTPLQIHGTLADLAVADDGTMHVLESVARDGGDPSLRTFAASGAALDTVAVEPGTSQVRMGPSGTSLVLERSSGLWRSATSDGQALEPSARASSGRPGRRTRTGGEVVVLRDGDEIRVAFVDARGARRAWVVTSATPLAEVQLAEPFGNRLVVVVRAYTESTDEFLVLVLGERRLATRFAVDSADWAETAPLSRFRLVGTDLYQLGSSPRSLVVERFDLRGRS